MYILIGYFTILGPRELSEQDFTMLVILTIILPMLRVKSLLPGQLLWGFSKGQFRNWLKHTNILTAFLLFSYLNNYISCGQKNCSLEERNKCVFLFYFLSTDILMFIVLEFWVACLFFRKKIVKMFVGDAKLVAILLDMFDTTCRGD